MRVSDRLRISIRLPALAAGALLTIAPALAFADGGPFNHCRCSLPGAAPHVSIAVAMLGIGAIAAAVARRRRSPRAR